MTTPPTFGTPVIGQAENALNAILHRQLAGTNLTEAQWVTLTLTIASDGPLDRDQLSGTVAGTLHISKVEAQRRVAELAAAHLLHAPEDGSPVKLTEAGQQLHSRIRTAVTQITQRLWGDLPAEDLDTAGRVLSTVLARANAELAGA